MRAVDLFAGFGGFTQGAQQAGVEVVWAANHWPLAVEVHAANHPTVQHACQDLRQADWTALPRFDLLLAAPACQGHSTASQPRRRQYHDAMRATAWSVVDCADVTEPAAIVVENVLSFRRWRLYSTWLEALARIGYRMREHVVCATRHGVPQRRERLFLVGTRKAKSIVLPLSLRVERPFGEFLEEPDPGGWRLISSASPGARERMRGAARRFGRNCCLVQHTTGHRGVPLTEAIRTITTKDHWVLVAGDAYRPLTLRELARGMGFPDSYSLPDVGRDPVIRGLGNAVCPPVARDLVRSVAEAA
jgi:DNA (cytosine-5)-methyltransferase 1